MVMEKYSQTVFPRRFYPAPLDTIYKERGY
jgi:hypothetical protein